MRKNIDDIFRSVGDISSGLILSSPSESINSQSELELFEKKCQSVVDEGRRALSQISLLDERFVTATSLDVDRIFRDFKANILKDSINTGENGELPNMSSEVDSIFEMIGLRFNEVKPLSLIGRSKQCASDLAQLRGRIENAVTKAERERDQAMSQRERFKEETAKTIVNIPGAVTPRNVQGVLGNLMHPSVASERANLSIEVRHEGGRKDRGNDVVDGSDDDGLV